MTSIVTFKDGKIEKGGFWVGPSPAASGTLNKPSLIVMHYTASGGISGKGDVDFFKRAKASASAHFVVGRDGVIYQVVELDRKAWHAGQSSWKGLSMLNGHSIGIEVDNWGWLTKRADGTFRAYSGEQVLAGNVVEAKHKNGKSPYKYWEAYGATQIEAVIILGRALKKALPSLTEIVGHEDIAPLRKTDPGPAFPWQHVLSGIWGNRDEIVQMYTVSTKGSSLNVRGGPSISFPKIGSLGAGAKVVRLRDQGEWTEVRFRTLFGGEKTGWVSAYYLRPT